MSGFLPGLADWALRGGAGNPDDDGSDDDDDNNDSGNQAASAEPIQPALTEDEMRARRLARMEAMQKRQQAEASKPTPMEVDGPEDKKPQASSTPKRPPIAATAATTAAMDVTPASNARKNKQSPDVSNEAIKKKKEAITSPDDLARKMQRKKELLLKRVLLLSLSGSATASDTSCVTVDIGDPNISSSSIAEILATRLSLEAESAALSTVPTQKELIPYLAQSHRRACEELKAIRQQQEHKREKVAELEEMLDEIQKQVVNYAASSLIEPDLFELGQDGAMQLAKAFIGTNPAESITFGIFGPASSFYNCLCDELMTQDQSAFQSTINTVLKYFMDKMSKCESVDAGVGDANPVSILTALTSVISNKKAAALVAQSDSFLPPAAGTPQADELIRLPLAQTADLLQMLANGNRPYKRRSGLGIEKQTLLGTVLRIGAPKSNPAFSSNSIFRQSLDSVERTTSSQRVQLRNYQEMCNRFVMNLVKGGAAARGKVMSWFIECLKLNVGATALRPDQTKVSSTPLLLNMQVVLLKLCEPFVLDDKKHRLIDPGFVSSAKSHGGVFETEGDDAIPRLGESQAGAEYNPKNAFIPQCFFFAARSIALGLAPALSHHENLLRHISHAHWEINSQNRDMQSDPHFGILVSRQRSNEVALFQPELVQDTLRFCNLIAKFLDDTPDEQLSGMPEHFVDNVCDIVMSIAKMKSKLLRGVELRHVFKLVVKLLSPKYANMVRNYNLRAMLGDVLYELYLPSNTDDRRDVPPSVSCDPLAGGQTFLLSDKFAQETLAPSLLLLYGEVEHTGYYDKMSHRAKISSLLKYLWESSEHRPAFRAITQNKASFIKFANGIMNETNTLIATVMQKLPEIREAQEKMANTQEWGRLSEDEQNVISSRLEDSERDVKHALPLCNKTLQMFGYLNTDKDIRNLFLLDELCPRLVAMLLHVLTKLVGSKGLDLKVRDDNLACEIVFVVDSIAVHEISTAA